VIAPENSDQLPCDLRTPQIIFGATITTTSSFCELCKAKDWGKQIIEDSRRPIFQDNSTH
jgi:hypothetical protein